MYNSLLIHHDIYMSIVFDPCFLHIYFDTMFTFICQADSEKEKKSRQHEVFLIAKSKLCAVSASPHCNASIFIFEIHKESRNYIYNKNTRLNKLNLFYNDATLTHTSH